MFSIAHYVTVKPSTILKVLTNVWEQKAGGGRVGRKDTEANLDPRKESESLTFLRFELPQRIRRANNTCFTSESL